MLNLEAWDISSLIALIKKEKNQNREIKHFDVKCLFR